MNHDDEFFYIMLFLAVFFTVGITILLTME